MNRIGEETIGRSSRRMDKMGGGEERKEDTLQMTRIPVQGFRLRRELCLVRYVGTRLLHK